MLQLVEKRTYLRFVPSDHQWNPQKNKQVIKEVATCLRLIESEKETDIVLPEEARKSVYNFWDIARTDILESWNFETDPANLQPKIRKLNRDVAQFIRSFKPTDIDEKTINKALDIVESPWTRRDEALLREQFRMDDRGTENSKRLISWITETGLEPAGSPQLLPSILEEDIKLICWLAITST